MSLSLLFWILMLLWFVFGGLSILSSKPVRRDSIDTVLLFLLLLVVGWKLFGAPFHS